MSFANRILKIYHKIPLSILNCIAPIYHLLPMRIKYGKDFCTTYQFLMKYEKISPEIRKKRELQQFRDPLQRAYLHIPYYKKLFDELGMDVSEIKNESDIGTIPFMTKELIRKHLSELLPDDIGMEKLIKVSTSGSTGEPLEFYQSSEIVMKEWAYTNYLWSRVGYQPNSSRLVLRGKIFRNQREKGIDWQWDALKRELSCYIFNMTDENMRLYCKKIEKYKPEYIHGYMSAVVMLCKYIEKTGLKHHFKAVLAVSETVLEEHRKYVERVLDTRVFSFYGHSERLVIAAECEQSTDYHVEPSYGYAEIVDLDGKPITKPGIEGELVATGFFNSAMPLIRYKTGDIAEWSDESACMCGRPHRRIKRISGRWNQDVLVNKGNAMISLAAINMHSDVFQNILKYQFYQSEVGKVILKIVVAENFMEKDLMEIKKQLQEKLGNNMDISVVVVEDIPINKNGKYKIVDQQLAIASFMKMRDE